MNDIERFDQKIKITKLQNAIKRVKGNIKKKLKMGSILKTGTNNENKIRI